MNFFILIDPPTATAQEKKVRVVHGKPLFYDPEPVKKAKALLAAHLLAHRPEKPLEGPLSLSTVWLFPRGKTHKHGESSVPWRTPSTPTPAPASSRWRLIPAPLPGSRRAPPFRSLI